MIDGYDTGIRYVDDQIGRIVSQLKAAGIYEETAIIISADHGENQGELGIYGEHGTADVGTCRIPLIIKWPGAACGENTALHYNLDLAPTLMDMLGGESCPFWDGQSYAPTLRNHASDTGRDEVVISQCAHVCQRSVRWGTGSICALTTTDFTSFPKKCSTTWRPTPMSKTTLPPKIPKSAGKELGDWRDGMTSKCRNWPLMPRTSRIHCGP